MPSKVLKRGKPKWLASTTIDGKRRQKLFCTKAEALAWEAEQRKGGGFQTSTDSLTLLEWMNDYLDYSQRFSERTRWEKKNAFQALLKVIDPGMLASALTPKVVLTALDKVARKRSGNAANKLRKNLIAAWNWGIKYLGLPRMNPCDVDRFPEVKHPRPVPTEEDFWNVYDSLQGQDQDMLLAYLHTAARRKELFELTWDDVDFPNQRVRLWTAKRMGGTKEFDWIPMTDELTEVLARQRTQVKCTYVFPDPETGDGYKYRIHFMTRACRRAGVRPFGFHGIRHLTASILIKNGVPLPTIQRILRHKNLTTTQRYVHELESARPYLKVLSRKKKGLRVEGSTQKPRLVAVK